MKIPFYIVNAFTDTAFAGNPAGVFFDDADILTAAAMRRMAGEVGLESAFVTSADADSGADFRLRYFTGTAEVPFCGHDTVSATTVLVHAGRIPTTAGSGQVRYQTPVGVVAVAVADAGRTVTLFQNLPEFRAPANPALVAETAAALGCSVEAITATGLPVQRVSTGSPWTIVPLAHRSAVDDAPADYDAITRIAREMDTLGMYVFAVSAPESNDPSDILPIWSRCFAPVVGLNEDPVTGSASGALGGYLSKHNVLKIVPGGFARAQSQQGFAGGRGGQAEIVVGRDTGWRLDQIAVTGKALIVATGEFWVTPEG